MPRVLEELRELNASSPLNESIRRWKDGGRKVIGWNCSFVPEEVIDAAGALPVRIIGGSHLVDLQDAVALISPVCCSYVHTILQLALNNQLDFLDGVVFANTCDAQRRLAEVWRHYVPIPIIYDPEVPRKSTDWARELFRNEVVTLKENLEKTLGTRVTDEGLEESVRVYNKGRELVRKLSELRKSDTPPISGTEVMEVINASCWMPRREFNAMLERLLDELITNGRRLQGTKRLMVVGSNINNPDFLDIIEKLGGLVVTDAFCSGVWSWLHPVETGNGLSILDNISRRYMDKVLCSRQMPVSRRFDQMDALSQEYRVGGIISQKLRFCVLQAYDQLLLRQRLSERCMPLLELETEYTTLAAGQIRTRVQAFLETLEARETAPV